MEAKIEKRVNDLFLKGYQNNDINNININRDIMAKILPYQNLHVFNMVNALRNHMKIIDGSYTGTGKTYTTIAVCAQLNLIPIIICPKSIIRKWEECCEYFGVRPLMCVNYETIRSGKYFDPNNRMERITCPYIRVNEKNFEWNFDSLDDMKTPRRINYLKTSDRLVFIFDEVHRCKKNTSQNGKLLISTNKKDFRVIMISATLCDRTIDFGIFGMMIGLYNNIRSGRQWIESVIREGRNKFGKDKNVFQKYIYPEYGSKMSMEDLGDDFPMNQIIIETCILEKDLIERVNNIYKAMEGENIEIGKISVMRQTIENIKMPIFCEMIDEYYMMDRSVVVFVNYRSSLEILTKYLDKKRIDYSTISGIQNTDERDESIRKFQENETKIMISMIQAGGVSVSLDDLDGKHPRVSLISPSFSSIELIQALGRIHRSSTRSPCLQKIIYCAGTLEEQLATILRKKKDLLSNITDNDLRI